MNNLLLRVITGFILAFFAVFLTYIGGIWFNFFMIILCGLAYFEYQNITSPKQSFFLKLCEWLFYAIVAFSVLVTLPMAFAVKLAIAFSLLLAIIAAYDSFFNISVKKINLESSFWLFFGFIYSVFPMLALIYLRKAYAFGDMIIFYLFASVWGSDIGGYVGGKLIGGVKLAPSISPNKTWSGALCGVFFAMIFVSVLGFFSKTFAPFFVLPALVLAIFAQLGDLFESMLKRRFSVKDSGSILPGHGGVLDRVDGLLFAAIVCFLFIVFKTR